MTLTGIDDMWAALETAPIRDTLTTEERDAWDKMVNARGPWPGLHRLFEQDSPAHVAVSYAGHATTRHQMMLTGAPYPQTALKWADDWEGWILKAAKIAVAAANSEPQKGT